MPFDGILTNCIAQELNSEITGARIEKIHMPEKDEVLISLRSFKGNCKLLVSANSSVARVHLTTVKKENPNSPPMFCMLLRKYLVGGRILSVSSYGFERVLIIEVESSNELGDLSVKKLIVEIMGKHSNLILVNNSGTIIDSIFHIDSSISSKREVMPARPYEWPPSQNKMSPDAFDLERFLSDLRASKAKTEKAILELILGFSPILARETCFRAKIEPLAPVETLNEEQIVKLGSETEKIIAEILSMQIFNAVYLIDYHCIKLHHLPHLEVFDTIDHTLDFYFNRKIFDDKLNQSKMTIMRIVSTNQDRCVKKLSLQQQSISDSENFDLNRKLGDILTANIHQLEPGLEKVRLMDFYSDDYGEIEIILDKNFSPQKNAQKYFKKYNKLKKTFEQANLQASETLKELEYLESIEHAIEQASNHEELVDIRLELSAQGYIAASKKKDKKAVVTSSTPNEYLSTDGFTIFSGKNNRQNDLLTLKSSKPDDFWFHTQKIPGTHVIIRTGGKNVPDRTLEEAAMISAWHSRAKNSAKVPVDYSLVRNVKKPPGAKPGMVTYDKFKTIIVTPEESLVKKLMIKK